MMNYEDLVSPLCEATAKLLAPFRRQEDIELELRGSNAFAARIESWQLENAILQRIPGARRMHGFVLLPATDTTCLILESALPNHVVFADEAVEMTYKFLIGRFMSGIARAKRQATYKEHNVIEFEPPIPHERLMDFQRVAAQCAMGTSGYSFFMEQGTGKTYAAIARIESEKVDKEGFPNCVLIVCPKNVRSNWEAEIEQFSEEPYAVQTFRGGKLDRLKTFIDVVTVKGVRTTYLITSYDVIANSIEMLTSVHWHTIVLDESHFIKSRHTKRWKALKKLRDKSRRRMCLTGTPIGNSLLDLWTQLEFLGEGYSGFVTYKDFERFHTKTHHTGSFKIITGFCNVPLLQERLARCSFVIKKKEALPQLPDKLYDIEEVELSPEQMAIYEKVANDLFVKISSELTGETNQMTVNNALVQMLRLSQITSGFVVYDEILDPITLEVLRPRAHDRFDPNPKLEALMAMLKAKSKKEKAIVWAHWVQDIKTIKSRLDYENIKAVTFFGATNDVERANAIDGFNNGDVQVLIGNPSCGGVGVNLLGQCDDGTNCDHVIYYSQSWSHIVRSQSEDRAHRRGTRVPVRVTDLCAPKTIDIEIRRRLMAKKDHAMKVQELRSLLSRMLQI